MTTADKMNSRTVVDCVEGIVLLDEQRRKALVQYLEDPLEVIVTSAASVELRGLKEQDFAQFFDDQKLSRRERRIVVTHLIDDIVDSRLSHQIELLNERVEQLSIVQTIQATVDGDALSYSTGKISLKRDRQFVSDVYQAYGYSKNQANKKKNLWCSVLGADVPRGAMSVGHIFKHEFHASVWAIMRFGNIDDPRNAIPMFRPIEVAFDELKLCILYDVDDDTFVTHVLDPDLMDVTFRTRMQQLLPSQQSLPDEIASLTFASLHGKQLEFRNAFRPYRRTLYYHAMQARKRAIAKGWKSAEWTFEDFSSEGYHRVSIKAWLNKAVTPVD